jgi:ankyrin repeat protein
MPLRKPSPTRTLRDHPDFNQLKRQAKDLLKAFTAGDANAIAEVDAHYHGARASEFALHDAQLVIARAYGFDSWPKLKAFVDGVTVERLAAAVRAGDLSTVAAMLDARPELINVDRAENDEHKPLHVAVLHRHPAMVRLLMQRGADARRGIWPHRDATGALTIAEERGDDDLAGIIREEERQRNRPAALLGDRNLAAIVAAYHAGDEDAIIAFVRDHPEFAAMKSAEGYTPLHWAAARGLARVAAWLLGHGADPGARTTADETPFDVIGREADTDSRQRTDALRLLRQRLRDTAIRTVRSAIATGDAEWLRAQHAAGALATQSGLLTHAVRVDRPDMLRLLLEIGLDPDEAGRVGGLDEHVPTFGEPLRECALGGKVEMAEILLAHGANPNTNVYAASSALSIAHDRKDTAMMALLERYGARLDPVFVAGFGLVAEAARMLAESGSRVARDLAWGAMGSASPEIARLALEHIDWPRGDRQWHGILENALYLGADSDRPRHLEAFKVVLARSGPDVTRLGATLLHDIAASRGGLTASDRLAYATVMLDAGARLDLRDDLLKSTPLGWACRWGRSELVTLLLDRGADPVERDAEAWATPLAWATKKGWAEIIEKIRGAAPY